MPRRLCIIVALFLSYTGAWAQAPTTATTTTTTLQQLLDGLIENNPEIRAAQYRFEAATKRPSQLRTLPDPKLTFVNTGVGQPFSSLNVSDFAYRAVGVSQEVPFPGKLALAAEEAQREADSERHRYRSMMLEKTAELKMAYYEWYAITKTIEVTAKNRDLLSRFEQIARARYAVGKGIQQDVLKAQVEISMLAQQLELLDQKRLSAEARIQAQVNSEAPLGRPVEVRQTALKLPLESILQLVETQSPRLQAGESMVQSRAVGIDRARRDYKPDFNFSLQWQKTGSQFPDNYMAAVEIRLPIHSSRKQQMGLEEAQARMQEARADYRAARQDLIFNAKDKYLTAMTSEKLLSLFQSGIIPQSAAALESAVSGYEVGNVDFLTLLNNAVTVSNFEMQYYQELARHEQAIAGLEPLVGMELTRD